MRIVTWQEFDLMARKLAAAVRAAKLDIHAVYGIPRGGLILATYLSHALDLPVMLTGIRPGKQVLVCDDNTITGETIGPYSPSPTAVLLHHPESHFTPMFYADTCTDWPIFPWEDAGCVNV